ncbi:MAG: shikimate kinase [Bacteroidales bacterium]|nr:shikimate kinase [Bacteroidales bacterium]
MLIALTGMMGCGKSSVGRALALWLGVPFQDLDEVIEQRTGKSIPEIFAEGGEAAFRRLEQEALEALLADRSVSGVLALGGGTVTTPACAELIREHSHCIYLRTSPETLVERLGRQPGGRPLLQTDDPAARIAALLEERAPLYESVASQILDTDAFSIENLVQKIGNGIIFAENNSKTN